ncbi:DUF5125 domain-containing protein [Sphingobacterium sp. SYP-B4668]|uniref:DUF5125 domain-containing protein n=1 Tax=Sphingobacterium sp. SYP-B4668 TaxID=2996035 RepID=UPI0022DD8E6C|nr:DUF5125 domain-containing protein [Sphingobacterium sp. SYP-B4668]
MRRILITGIALISALGLWQSCKKDDQLPQGSPVLSVQTDVKTAHFGDSLSFKVNVSDPAVPLSTVKVQLYYTDDLVAETVIRTKENGAYMGKVYIPYFKDVPDGTATLKFVLQNISKTKVEQAYDLVLKRPDFPYLTLVTDNQSYRMEKVAANSYAVTQNFPYAVKGYISAQAVGEQGNPLTFGWENNSVALGSVNQIPFSNSVSGTYTISFNTFSFDASPFIIAYAVNGSVMSRVNDDNFKAELQMTKGELVTVDGIEGIDEWWMDPDYFKKDDTGKWTFHAATGKYRVTANFPNKYLIVEAMDGNNLASLKADGTGAIWIIGEGIGKPSVAANQVGWNTDKALCLAPIGNKKYQITVTGNKTIKTDNINFKFFHQKNWGGEFGGTAISTTSDIIFIGDGKNGRDSGNLGLVTGKTIPDGKTYVLTVDLTAGNDKAVLTVTPQ